MSISNSTPSCFISASATSPTALACASTQLKSPKNKFEMWWSRLSTVLSPEISDLDMLTRPRSVQSTNNKTLGWGLGSSCFTRYAVSYTHLRAHETRHDLV